MIIPARSKETGEKAKEKIVEEVAHAKIEVMELDLSSLASVRSFAAAFLSSNKPLNLLMYVDPPTPLLSSFLYIIYKYILRSVNELSFGLLIASHVDELFVFLMKMD